jgi:hypothetical protein
LQLKEKSSFLGLSGLCDEACPLLLYPTLFPISALISTVYEHPKLLSDSRSLSGELYSSQSEVCYLLGLCNCPLRGSLFADSCEETHPDVFIMAVYF